MKKICIVLLCLTLLFSSVGFTTAVNTTLNEKLSTQTFQPETSWNVMYGRILNDEMGISVDQTDDEGYIVVGAKSTSLINIHSQRDVWLLKFDADGKLIWEKNYGGWGDDVGHSVQQTSDGGYVITGYTTTRSIGKKDVWIIKTDANGMKQWDTSYGTEDFDSGSAVKETSDGGFIIVGNTNTSGGGLGDVWLIKIDSMGNKIWDKSFGGNGHNYADDILQTEDNGFIIIGSSWVPDETDSYDMWLIKTDEHGNMVWNKKYNKIGSDHGWSLGSCADGGYIFVGEADHSKHDKIWLVKTNDKGDILWDKTYSGRGESVCQTSDGGYIVAGYEIDPTMTDFSNGIILKTDSNGEQVWRKSFGGKHPDFFFSIQQTIDNGFIATGHTAQTRFDSALWFVKIESDNPITQDNSVRKDGSIFIEDSIHCPSKPFLKGDEEQFSVTINNTGDTQVTAEVDFYLWEDDDKEWEWFDESICIIDPGEIKETDPNEVQLLWPGCWCQEPQSPQDPPSPLWPGRFRPQEIRAVLYVDDELVDTQENRFFMGFFIF